MLLTPLRSDTKAIDRPSGAHCGLTFLPWSMWSSTWIVPVARSYSAIRKLPMARVLKSVSGPRSVAKAMVFPSGDQTGCRSAYLSLVSRRRFAAVAVDDEQVAQAAVVAGEDQLLAVRAPGRRGDAAQLELDPPDLLVARDVHDDDVVPRRRAWPRRPDTSRRATSWPGS